VEGAFGYTRAVGARGARGVRWLALTCACIAGGCARKESGSSPSDSPASNAARSPEASAASTAPAFLDAVVPDDSSLQGRIARLFAQYKDGSDFEFLRSVCASPLLQFITLKNVGVDASDR
jgi:hypothetical protein